MSSFARALVHLLPVFSTVISVLSIGVVILLLAAPSVLFTAVRAIAVLACLLMAGRLVKAAFHLWLLRLSVRRP